MRSRSSRRSPAAVNSNSLLKVFSTSFLPLFLISSCTPSPGEAVLAHVGKEKIVVTDLKRLLDEQAGDYNPEVLNSPEGNLAVKKQLLNGLIEETLLLSIAREKGIALSWEEQQNPTAALQSGYSEGTLQRMLEEKKISLPRWIERQRKKRVIEKLIEQEVTMKIHPTDAESDEFYRKNPQLFTPSEQVHCRHIVAGKKEKAKTIRSLLEKGESFAAVAKEYSESPDRETGGDLGFFGRGDYPPIFEQACFNLAVGQTSEVVASEYGFHIFRVVEKKPARRLSLEEMRPAIERRLKEESGREALRSWLEEIHRNHKITIDEKALREVPLAVFKVEERSP